MPCRRTPLGARPLEAAISGARGYCGPAELVYQSQAVVEPVVELAEPECRALTPLARMLQTRTPVHANAADTRGRYGRPKCPQRARESGPT